MVFISKGVANPVTKRVTPLERAQGVPADGDVPGKYVWQHNLGFCLSSTGTPVSPVPPVTSTVFVIILLDCSMETTVDNEDIERSRTTLVGLGALGIAFVFAGLALFYGLATDSMQVFTAALVAVLLLVAASLIVILRTESLISRENAVISVCVIVAMALYLGLSTVTTLPNAVLVGTLIFVGVIVPGLVLQYWSAIIE